MSERRHACLDAAAALLAADWEPERIALALGISRATVERLITSPASPVRLAVMAPDGCCRIIADPRRGTARYCNDPVKLGGAVFCARHYRSEIRAS